MILAYHSIMSFYGFWLPNDPRGSGSDYVAQWELFRYGPATKIKNRRQSVAHRPHDRAKRLAAKQALSQPPVSIAGEQALAVAQGFHQALLEAGYRFHALAILPEHLHCVIGWHWRDIRILGGHLRAKATRHLRQLGLWDARQLWGEHGWNVPLDSVAGVARAIAYAEANPEKEGKRAQRWSFVTPFDRDQVIQDRSAAHRDGIDLYQKRKVGGAAKRSHDERVAREAELEPYLRSLSDEIE